MHKADYENVAYVINGVGNAYKGKWVDAGNQPILEIAQRLSELFAEDNPNFNRAWFMAACFEYQQHDMD